jgi:hypothetical protein
MTNETRGVGFVCIVGDLSMYPGGIEEFNAYIKSLFIDSSVTSASLQLTVKGSDGAILVENSIVS